MRWLRLTSTVPYCTIPYFAQVFVPIAVMAATSGPPEVCPGTVWRVPREGEQGSGDEENCDDRTVFTLADLRLISLAFRFLLWVPLRNIWQLN